MVPKRIKKKKKKELPTPAPRMENKVESPRPKRKMGEIKKDAREEIVKLNQEKLKRDITELQDEFNKRGMKNANSGSAGFLKNRMELGAFVEQAKKDGLTNEQALARFKKQYKL